MTEQIPNDVRAHLRNIPVEAEILRNKFQDIIDEHLNAHPDEPPTMAIGYALAQTLVEYFNFITAGHMNVTKNLVMELVEGSLKWLEEHQDPDDETWDHL